MFRRLQHTKIVYTTGFLFLFVVLLLLAGCSVQRKAIKEPLKEYGVDYLFDNMKKNEFKFEWLTANFSAEIEIDKKKNSFKGMIRIRKDSAIWISITPALGIEVGRLMITNDSIKLLNRLNSTYFIGDFKKINKILSADIDLDMLQGFLAGNDFTYYENGELGKFKANIENKEYHLSTAERRKLKKHIRSTEDADRLFIQNIWLKSDSFKITSLSIKEKKLKEDNRKLVVFYDDFRQLDNQLFPYHLLVEIFDKEEPIKININYYKITTNIPQTFPFTISSKYQRIEK